MSTAVKYLSLTLLILCAAGILHAEDFVQLTYGFSADSLSGAGDPSRSTISANAVPQTTWVVR